MASSIAQVRVGMGMEGDWDDDTNFDKVSDDVFLFPLKKKEKRKNGRGSARKRGKA